MTDHGTVNIQRPCYAEVQQTTTVPVKCTSNLDDWHLRALNEEKKNPDPD